MGAFDIKLPPRLRALINVLNKTTDEEISTYSLEKMGFPLGRVLK